MSVPNWWQALLLALAAWRIFQLLAEDTILDKPRARAVKRLGDYWEAFLTCPYCAGFWIALIWWGAWQLWPHATLVAAVPFALSAGVVAGARLLSPE